MAAFRSLLSACNKYGQRDRSLEAVVMSADSGTVLISFTIQRDQLRNLRLLLYSNASIIKVKYTSKLHSSHREGRKCGT